MRGFFEEENLSVFQGELCFPFFNPFITNGTYMSRMLNLFTYGTKNHDLTNLIPAPFIKELK